MRPTRGVPLALVTAALLHLLARQSGVGWLELGSAGALALPLVAVLRRPRVDGLAVATGRLQGRVGAPVAEQWRITNTARRTSSPARITEVGPLLEPATVAVPALRPGETVVAELLRSPVRRGRTSARALTVTATTPVGMLRTTSSLQADGELVVAPVAVLPGRPAVPGGVRTGQGSTTAGSGTEILGLRPWRNGDGSRAVAARASARHGRPVVLEREGDSGAQLVVVCTAVGAGPEWEAQVARSCALVEQTLREGRAVALVATGLTVPAQPDRSTALTWHAGLDAAAPLDSRTLAEARRAAGSAGSVALLGPPVPGLFGTAL